MSIKRSYAILIKDLYWTLSNFKLASLLVVPLIISILFNQVGMSVLTSVSYTFTISFIGIFMTAMSVTEEKKHETLLCLLTTPLRGSEFIFGKITTSLILCFIFCLASGAFGQTLNHFTNIYFLLNLLLFSFIASSLGCFLGLLCKNEQVLTIIGSPLMIIFAMGTFFSDLLLIDFKSSFLPDFHFVKSIDIVSGSDAFMHVGFNLLTSVIFLLMTISYVNFYFKYGREKILNKMIIFQMITLVIPFLLSGYIFVTEKESINRAIVNKENVAIKTVRWNLEIPQDVFKINLLMKNELQTRYVAKLKKSSDKILILIIKTKKLVEGSRVLRNISFRKRKEVLFHEVVPIEDLFFDKWVYSSKPGMKILYELYDKKELLMISMKSKTSQINDIFEMKKKLESFLSKIKIKQISPK